MNNIIFTNHVGRQLDQEITAINPDRIFLLTDINTRDAVIPRLQMLSQRVADAHIISIPPGDLNKNLDSLANIWQQLSDNKATRSSLLVNVGGGVITDIGAFAASTFKRGIPYINIPTTLLAAVDASVGGKTGINFNGLKNEIGTFSSPRQVIISTIFFNTLSHTEILSGYAEMIKHALLDSPQEFSAILAYNPDPVDPDRLLDLLQRNIRVKSDIVTIDPTEKGPRRALNLGHTAGHAFETLAMERHSPIPHGYAVAYGLIVAAVLSHIKCQFPTDTIHTLAAYIHQHYGAFAITCDDYPHLLEIMTHDKKNTGDGNISFTLLSAVGQPQCGIPCTPADITAALDLYRDILHLP